MKGEEGLENQVKECCKIAGHSTAPKGESQFKGGWEGVDGRGVERVSEGGKQGEGV